MTIKVFGWVMSKFIKPDESLLAEDYVRAEAPTNCPICNGKIEQKPGSEEYVCLGLANREEIEKHHPIGAKMPKNVTEVASCGWHARADDYGKLWE